LRFIHRIGLEQRLELKTTAEGMSTNAGRTRSDSNDRQKVRIESDDNDESRRGNTAQYSSFVG
jgi:hypothetical protein